jgi:P27 family predicted phage terminase small subunit
VGKRGPKPLTSKELKFRGSWRAKGREAAELALPPLDVLPPPPAKLGNTGRFEWLRIGQELIAKGLLSHVDMAAFAGYCFAVQHAYDAEVVVALLGPIVDTIYGPKERPEVRMAERAWDRAVKFGQMFGITPGARTRVKAQEAPPAPKDDPWGDVADG